ncbi:hypothetical protein ACTA71_000855 [Dictyostelium dimigraforme]
MSSNSAPSPELPTSTSIFNILDLDVCSHLLIPSQIYGNHGFDNLGYKKKMNIKSKTGTISQEVYYNILSSAYQILFPDFHDLTSMDLGHRESVDIKDSNDSITNNWDQIIAYDDEEPKTAEKIYILLAIECRTKFAVEAFPGSVAAHGALRTPTTQGVIERLNQTIKNTIKGLMADEGIGMTPNQASQCERLFHEQPTENSVFYGVNGEIQNTTISQRTDYNICSIINKQSDL